MAPRQIEKIKQQFAGLTPTEEDSDPGVGSTKNDAAKGVNSDGSEVQGKFLRLKNMARDKADGKMGNPSQLGDPISLKAETDDYEAYETGDGPDRQRKARESKL